MSTFSKIGFIMATLGSSIGLGHIWRFPTMAGQNGGAVFILLFVFISVAIGVSMLIAEMLMGNRTHKNAQDAVNRHVQLIQQDSPQKIKIQQKEFRQNPNSSFFHTNNQISSSKLFAVYLI